MVKIEYELEFLTYWHAGSGLTAGAQADAVVIKDEHGLPYFPGKTLKGIFRDSFLTLKDVGLMEGLDEKSLFGQVNQNREKEIQAGKLFFSNAELPEKEALKDNEGLIPQLYDTLASTEINENGVAENASLRVVEVTIPLKLQGTISGFDSPEEAQHFSRVLAFTKYLGGHRNRGLGRCIIRQTNRP